MVGEQVLSTRDFIVEHEAPPLINLKMPHPFIPKERSCLTPTIMELDVKGNLIKLSGVRFSINGIEEVSKKVKSYEDILNYILSNNTCFLSCSYKFLPVLIKSLPAKDILMLSNPQTKDWPVGNYNLTLGPRSLLVRQGNLWGRVYSFWDAYPETVVPQLNEYDPNPISLNDFYRVFSLVLRECWKEGLSLSTLNSAASVGMTLLLSGKSIKMFGNLEKIDMVHIQRAHQCYKGSVFEAKECSSLEGYYYDIVSSFPSVLGTLTPCYPPYMEWADTKEYIKSAFYGFLKCLVFPSHEYIYSPAHLRYTSPLGDRLGGFQVPQEIWMTKPEYDGIYTNGMGKLEILEGSWGIPKLYKPLLKGPMTLLYQLRNNSILSRIAKQASQMLAGKIGSHWEEELKELFLSPEGDLNLNKEFFTNTSPIFQIIYSAHVNGAVRAQVDHLGVRWNASAKRADGVVTRGPIPDEYLLDAPGGLKLKSKGRMLIVDDIACDLPGPTRYLDLLTQADPKKVVYEYPRFIVRTPFTSSREFATKRWPEHIGDVVFMLEKRRINSHKRLPTNSHESIEDLLTTGLETLPPRTIQDSHFIMEMLKGHIGYL